MAERKAPSKRTDYPVFRSMPTRWADNDVYGHMNNVVHYSLFDTAVNGWLIEKGKLTAPIKDVNIIGNGPEALRRITMVAGDSKLDTGGWTCGKDGQSVPVSQGMPTCLVSSLTVGGENA